MSEQPGHLVPPALGQELCDRFGLQPWQLGLAPPPPASWWQRHIKAPTLRTWYRITGQW